MNNKDDEKRFTIRFSSEDMEHVNKLLPRYENNVTKVVKECVKSVSEEKRELGISIYQEQAEELGYEPNAKGIQTFLNDAIACFARRKKGKEIPYNKVTKQETADFLGITQLDKRWAYFMDNIDRIYYEK
jgi:hypothetical protein